jgi:regulator of RNase E activity RraA
MKPSYRSLFLTLALAAFISSLNAQSVVMSKETIIALTPEWKGERLPDGRPKVPDHLMERVKNLSLEETWAGLREEGYMNQFAGDWKMIHPGQPIVGRALTAQYMPRRVVVRQVLEEQGKKDGHIGDMVSWPIDMLSNGDVYVADSYAKLNEGPIIGDNLGTSIYAKSGNGVVFNGTLRDLDGLAEIEGFNAFVKGWHPSHQMEMMLTGINVPIRIDEVTVMPGDVVLARREGVIFIPPHLLLDILLMGEFTALRDAFGHQRLREGIYTPGQIDGLWSKEIKKDFMSWLDKNPDKLPMPREELEQYMKETTW